MSAYKFAPEARLDLEEILEYIEREDGVGRACGFEADIMRAVARLAEHPWMGHVRPELTTRSFLFWSVHSHLVIYRPDSKPLEIVRIMHGKRDPKEIRDQVGDSVLPSSSYAVAG